MDYNFKIFFLILQNIMQEIGGWKFYFVRNDKINIFIDIMLFLFI